MNCCEYYIERLLSFGVKNGLISDLDVIVARNTLLDIFGLTEPYSEFLVECNDELPTDILETLLNFAAEKGLFDNEIPNLRVNFEARIMGALMPRANEVANKFNELRMISTKKATDYFYDLCIKSNYIRTAQIAKNIKWDYNCEYGNLEITINLTKPEKDPKTIALERLQPSSSYPKCMLCQDNIGYAGRVNFPARQTHRIVPVTLNNEDWFLQYSPYVYYNEHCIIFSSKHEPMSINDDTFELISSFVEQFPHYTCGSNADLPIVGGSILSHTHFQGGNYSFPMQSAEDLSKYKCEEYPNITISSINWPMSAVRVKGENLEEIKAFSKKFLSAWREYSDETIDVLAYSIENGETVPHNTVTPIIHHKNGVGFIMDLVPRNNRTTQDYPMGIFHPHQEIHHIKKENIGLIEVMGLAILPARLKNQTEEISQVLSGTKNKETVKQTASEHSEWIDYLVDKYGINLDKQQAVDVVKLEIGIKFKICLEHAGVFKLDENGMAACDKFMKTLNCIKI